MSFFSSFLLGLIQGIAEFLPISSSGHLAIAQNLLGMQDAGVVPEFLMFCCTWAPWWPYSWPTGGRSRIWCGS